MLKVVSPCFIVILLVISTTVQGQTVDDIIGTSVNEPICISVTSNDATGTIIQSFTNSTNGYTYRNYLPFHYANSSNRLVFEVEKYQIANFENTTDPYYLSNPTPVWVSSANVSGASGGIIAYPSPIVGFNTGSSNYGRSLVYNVMFRTKGVYYLSLRGSGPTQDSDSAHILFQPDLNSATQFISRGSAAWNGIGTTLIWTQASFTINVTKVAPSIARFYLAVREDGITCDQLFFANTSASLPAALSGSQATSRFISCSSEQILYFPATGFSGVDVFNYTASNGIVNTTSTVSVYVGVALPSVTPTPTPTSSPSRSPTPSVSPSVTPSVTPSRTASPSFGSSPSVTPSVTPSTSVSSSVTPSISPSASVTPTASITPTISPSNSVTPTASVTASASPTPSPLPPMCDGVYSASTQLHTLTPGQPTSNFGQTFKPFASGTLFPYLIEDLMLILAF
eukprot:CAMPEP_0168551450 /NCGR_PEP_ID=MMETSP0413-20121227/6179_1 /TAXON_ID=136452 /ORGANISM="Filamoeba nolandi, Strain NC-AS-23-1" /LENGTH=453 /DNA_ID=CAMNT_0008581977 /DNA_START=362 /DNA_END=1724 /DNA_ORIENTATION=+